MTISQNEALTRIRAWYSSEGAIPPGASIGIREFELGYVGWIAEPEPEPTNGPPRPPMTVGVARIVIDRQTGAASMWPCLPISTVIAQFTAHHQAEIRFSEPLRQALTSAGWRPGQDLTASVNLWLRQADESARGVQPPAAVRSFLAEFGMVSLPRLGLASLPGYHFHPAAHQRQPQPVPRISPAITRFQVRTGIAAFPIGYRVDDLTAELVMDQAGQVFLLDGSGDYYVGTGDEAIVALAMDHRLSVVREDGTW